MFRVRVVWICLLLIYMVYLTSTIEMFKNHRFQTILFFIPLFFTAHMSQQFKVTCFCVIFLYREFQSYIILFLSPWPNFTNSYINRFYTLTVTYVWFNMDDEAGGWLVLGFPIRRGIGQQLVGTKGLLGIWWTKWSFVGLV